MIGGYVLLRVVLVNVLVAEACLCALPVTMAGPCSVMGIGHLVFTLLGREIGY